VSARIRAGSRFRQFLRFVLIHVRCFRVSPGVRILQVEDHILRGSKEPGPDKQHPEGYGSVEAQIADGRTMLILMYELYYG
jgi:hypothetical protein